MDMIDELNGDINREKKEFEEYIYVMCSTLNQMVNYIPLKLFEFKEIYTITTKLERDEKEKKIVKYFDNEKWDENLEKALDNNPKKIVIDKEEFYSLTSVKNRLIKEIEDGGLKKEKIFWNITGGQRHIIMAIQQVAKRGDVICYLEGNNNQIMIYDAETDFVKPFDYALNLEKDLTIEIALKLMGFEFNSKNEKIGKDDEREFYRKFYSKYISNKELREWLIILNKGYPKLRDKKKNESEESYKKLKDEYLKKKKEFEEIKKSARDKIKKILSDLDETMLQTKLNRNQEFGYILEELAFYELERVLKPLIDKKKVTLVHSLKIKNTEINDVTVAEFDIALLTDNGKFIMFECKSGGMTGDTAKARNYATYAVSGVYGLPILITPILSTEEDKDLKDEILQDDYYDIYKNIKSAIASGERASLDVWGLDKIEDNLKKYI